jgi:hypothetical protein
MSILNKAPVLKGVASQFSINKSELLSLPIVQADDYFSEPLNWNLIKVVYMSSEGKQYEIVEFDAKIQTPVGNFLVSDKARDLFQVQKVVIFDFDNGFLEIQRSQLTVAEWDIDFN